MIHETVHHTSNVITTLMSTVELQVFFWVIRMYKSDNTKFFVQVSVDKLFSYT
jgi:hypothetical protein